MSKSRILVGVAGGIAAYKVATLVSRLAQTGYEVRVAMSKAATAFVGPATFAALSGQQVCTDLFDSAYPLGAHIELGRWADLYCVAPGTAAFMGNAAQGLTNGLLSATYMCVSCPVLVAPAMNVEMWKQPATQRNVTQLNNDGVHFVGPETGWLSCRTEGVGRMAEPDAIFQSIESLC